MGVYARTADSLAFHVLGAVLITLALALFVVAIYLLARARTVGWIVRLVAIAVTGTALSAAMIVVVLLPLGLGGGSGSGASVQVAATPVPPTPIPWNVIVCPATTNLPQCHNVATGEYVLGIVRPVFDMAVSGNKYPKCTESQFPDYLQAFKAQNGIGEDNLLQPDQVLWLTQPQCGGEGGPGSAELDLPPVVKQVFDQFQTTLRIGIPDPRSPGLDEQLAAFAAPEAVDAINKGLLDPGLLGFTTPWVVKEVAFPLLQLDADLADGHRYVGTLFVTATLRLNEGCRTRVEHFAFDALVETNGTAPRIKTLHLVRNPAASATAVQGC